MPAMSVSEAIATRRSVRAFLDKPVDLDVLPGAPVNQFLQPRVPLAEQVRFHGF